LPAHRQEVAQIHQGVGKREAGDGQDVGPFGQFVGVCVEQRGADADRHDPPCQNLGESACAMSPNLANAPDSGRDERQIAQRIDRLRPEGGGGPLAVEIDLAHQKIKHENPVRTSDFTAT
jgi:hypothetical protein